MSRALEMDFFRLHHFLPSFIFSHIVIKLLAVHLSALSRTLPPPITALSLSLSDYMSLVLEAKRNYMQFIELHSIFRPDTAEWHSE